ncbi:MAG: ATP-dependent Clp protease adapter ClpS [Flaviflexus sp.]|nr:ATP-dependent Clp protease adapter ClpS [Flaviflexus sp.]
MSPTQPSPTTDPALKEGLGAEWHTIVHDDPVNLMSYVSWVFESYFGYDRRSAERLMMKVHTRGFAIVSTGSKEAMERDAQAMHTYGLWASVREGS